MKKCNKGLIPAKLLVSAVAILLSFLISMPAFAQGPVTGTVAGKDGTPVSGATVTVKNKKINACIVRQQRETLQIITRSMTG